MTVMKLKGRRYDTGQTVCVSIEGDRIQSVEPISAKDPASWPIIAPGMFDLQINGHGGTWFTKDDLTVDEVHTALEAHFKFGITRMCPTLVTSSFEELAAGFSAIATACESEPWADRMVPGCHLEGPYIASEDGPRGAHPLEHVRPADWDEFSRLQEISGNRICLVTLAPEVDGAIPFIRQAVAAGITISIGHTGANADQIAAAVEAGARLSTHLGNGAHGMLRRHPNYIWEQLGEPRLWASIITDGYHLPPSVIRTMIRTKSVENTIITCDAAGFAGCPPGIYEKGSLKTEILEDGRLVVAGQRQLLAGSGVETDTCVAHAVDVGQVTLQQALDMAGLNPARLLGFEQIRLEAGCRADLILFNYAGPGSPLHMLATLAAGELQFGNVAAHN